MAAAVKDAGERLIIGVRIAVVPADDVKLRAGVVCQVNVVYQYDWGP